MALRPTWLFCLVVAFSPVAAAQETVLLEGEVPGGDDTFFFLEFEVPEGIEEIEVAHTHVPAETSNVLDWGVDDPNGLRGWGGNNPENAIIGVRAASRSYVPGPIPAGTWRVTVGKARIEPNEPAGYSVEVTLRTTATLEPQPRAPYRDPGALSSGARWYAGDFHVHTRESGDARATLTTDEALEFAAGRGLDFVLLSEHNTVSGLTLYADAQARHPDVLIIPGQEFTTYLGHANAIGATEPVPYTVGTDGYSIADAIAAFRAQGALFSINHPVHPLPDCRGCNWDWGAASPPDMIDAIETQTGILRAMGFWEAQIEAGSRATAVAGSDDHQGGQGSSTVLPPIGTPTTMVYAAELSVSAIVEGVRSGRTVVKVAGPDAPMIETELSGPRVANTVFADRATLSAVVAGGEGRRLVIVKNGEPVDAVPIASDPFTYAISVEAPGAGEDRYRHEVQESSTAESYSSYVWLRKAADLPDNAASDGGGCSARGVHRGGVLASMLLLVAGWLVRRRIGCRL